MSVLVLMAATVFMIVGNNVWAWGIPAFLVWTPLGLAGLLLVLWVGLLAAGFKLVNKE
jgi:hypothetical protein